LAHSLYLLTWRLILDWLLRSEYGFCVLLLLMFGQIAIGLIGGLLFILVGVCLVFLRRGGPCSLFGLNGLALSF
ncbi:MAG: hypothetical protein ACKPKO_15700, partial [Candidatus Fonsibacter sp.]